MKLGRYARKDMNHRLQTVIFRAETSLLGSGRVPFLGGDVFHPKSKHQNFQAILILVQAIFLVGKTLMN